MKSNIKVVSYLILSNISNSTYLYVSDTFRGAGPFSEPETAAVRDFINAQKQNQDFQVYLILLDLRSILNLCICFLISKYYAFSISCIAFPDIS